MVLHLFLVSKESGPSFLNGLVTTYAHIMAKKFPKMVSLPFAALANNPKREKEGSEERNG